MSRSRHVRPSSPAVPRHRRRHNLPRLIQRGTIGMGIVALAALLGLGGTAALWSSSTSITPGAVYSGSLTVDAATAAAVRSEAFVQGADAPRYFSVSLTNTGSTTAALSVSTPTPSNDFAKAVTVAFALGVNVNDCSTVTYGTSGSWSAVPPVNKNVAPGEQVVLCVKTALDRSANVSGSYETSLTLTLTRGMWTASKTAKITQSVQAAAQPVAPATITCASAWGGGITIGWAQAPGMKDGMPYRIVVGGVTQQNSANAGYHTGVDFRSSGLVGAKAYTMDVFAVGSGIAHATREVYRTASGAVLCADPAQGPLVEASPGAAKFDCADNTGSSVKLAWSNPSGADGSWVYEARVGTTVLGNIGGYYTTNHWLGADKLSGFAKNQQHRVDIVRTGTQTVLFTGVIGIVDNGNLWCIA